MTLRHIGLFEGIGGFSLAARWMGWETIAWCEWNEFGQKVLKYHFPKAEGHGDITTTDFRPYRGKCDILTGGFPCQPYSSAGKRLGKEDDRHLWPEMLRAVREVRPKWVVGENVLGIVNWNDGLVFDEVQADLEAEGYEVQPYVLPACAVNAPHRRDRTWFIAFNPNSSTSGKGTYLGGKDGGGISESTKERVFQEKNDKCTGFGEVPPKEGTFTNTLCKRHNEPTNGANNREERKIYKKEQGDRNGIRSETGGHCESVADPNNTGFQKKGTEQQATGVKQHGKLGGNATNPNSGRFPGKEHRKEESGQYSEKGISEWFQDFPTKSPVCGGNDGIPRKLDSITFPKWRNESIKAYGNAIVPQVALQIFKSIEKYEELCNKKQV